MLSPISTNENKGTERTEETILPKMTKDEIEDRETEKALKEFAKTVKEMKRREWEEFKDVFPDLYKEEVGGKSSAHLEVERIIDKLQGKIDDLAYKNEQLKENVRELKKLDKAKDKAFEKKLKEIMKSKNVSKP